MNVYLIIDTGTSSMRSLLYSQTGELLASFQRTYQMTLTEDGGATMDASVFRNALYALSASAAGYAADQGLHIRSLSFTSQRSSVLPLSENGTPLAPILMWYDKRCQDICASFSRQQKEQIHRISGMLLSPVCSAPKMLWLKQSSPDLYESAYKLAGIHDYLLYIAAGVFCTDVTCAGRTCLLDAAALEWSLPLLCLFGLSYDKLCALKEPGSVAGFVTPSFSRRTGLASGLPVITAGGDQQCSCLGLGIRRSGETGINSGTASYVTTLSDTPETNAYKGVNTVPSALPGKWLLEAANTGSGSVYNWFCRQFYSPRRRFVSTQTINQAVLSSPAGARGVLCLPSFAGKGCPDWNGGAKGAFCNIGLHNQKEDFARALLEGICSEIYDCWTSLPEAGLAKDPILSSGGMSRFPEFNQILADMMNLPVSASDCPETTSLGAFLNTLRALGETAVFERLLSSPRREHGRIFRPRPGLHELYMEQHALRTQIYQNINS
jgi:Sugar (pentulose and hexulose) kinases